MTKQSIKKADITAMAGMVCILVFTIFLISTHQYTKNCFDDVHSVLSFLNQNIISQIFAVCIGAVLAYSFQLIFKRAENDKIAIANAHKFNESVFYTASLLERIVSHIDGLIINNYQNEKNMIDILEKQSENQIPHITFFAIPPYFKVSEKKLIQKIPNIGMYPELASAFYRLQDNADHFNIVAEERIFKINEVIKTSLKPSFRQLNVDRAKEISQRTEVLLCYAETTLDCLTFIATEQLKISEKMKEDFKKHDLKIFRLEETTYYRDLRNKLKLMIDGLPNQKGRMLHMFESKE